MKVGAAAKSSPAMRMGLCFSFYFSSSRLWPYSSGWGLTSSAYNEGAPTEADQEGAPALGRPGLGFGVDGTCTADHEAIRYLEVAQPLACTL